ncbi:MAG: hypothetical protein KIS76_04075 [Pyrinomonadaceae bacterium]|nr:hypothetical protein [Pyrinomonadaceae bacterium]
MRESLFPGKIGRWCLGAVLAAAVLFGGVGQAAAYDDDTHFWLTYFLAVKAGYTRIQAAQIASAKTSVDTDKHSAAAAPVRQLSGLFSVNT